MATKNSDAVVLDFSNVKEGSDIKPKRLPAGDYVFKITKYTQSKTKENNHTMWTFILVPEGYKSASYPYRCILTESSLWTLRNLLIACGLTVPKKSVRVDPAKLVGKLCGGALEDDEYNGREKSEITAVFSADEVDSPNASDDSDDEDTDEDVSDEELDELEVDEI